MDKILRVNMGAEGGPTFQEVPVGDYAGLGGRALTSALVAKEVPPLCHPLGEENKLVIAPGMLSGTTAAMSGTDLGRLQKPAHRRHQGSQCRRAGLPGPGPAGICGHRPRRKTEGRHSLQDPHQQGRGEDHRR